jgi:hypothetical protein
MAIGDDSSVARYRPDPTRAVWMGVSERTYGAIVSLL